MGGFAAAADPLKPRLSRLAGNLNIIIMMMMMIIMMIPALRAPSPWAAMSVTSVFGYLTTISSDDLSELYRVPYCALSVLQSLCPVARTFILRLLPFRAPVKESLLRAWLRPGASGDALFRYALAELRNLSLLCPPAAGAATALSIDGTVPIKSGVTDAYILYPVFADALAVALTNEEAVPWEAASRELGADDAPLSADDVERGTAERWNAILHYLLGTEDAPPPEPKVTELLVSTGLLAPGLDAAAAVAGDFAGVVMSGNALTAGATDDEEDDDESVSALRGSGARGGAAGAAAAVKVDGRPMTFAEIFEAGGGDTHITRAGYDFLLKDTAVQLWTFLHAYIGSAARRGMRATDILSLLFQLGFCRLGESYAIGALSPTQVALLEDFAAFGLVLIQGTSAAGKGGGVKRARASPTPLRFYPSSLAILLTQSDVGGTAPAHPAPSASAPPGGAASTGVIDLTADDDVIGSVPEADGAVRHGFAQRPSDVPSGFYAALVASSREAKLTLVVETNFKIYAYTTLGLHLALLALFSRVEQRLPNLVVATLTRRAVMAAFARGLTARRIVAFLAARVHPAAKASGVPENVEGQLVLWERERARVLARRAVLVGPLANAYTYTAVVAAVRESVLWADEKRRIACISADVEDTVNDVLAKNP